MARVIWTMREAAKRWDVSRAQVQKWRDQKRIKAERHGATWIIIDDVRPKPAKRGDLTPEQRAVYQGGKYKVKRDTKLRRTLRHDAKIRDRDMDPKLTPQQIAGRARAASAKRDSKGRLVA